MSGLILIYNQGFSWMEEAATREKDLQQSFVCLIINKDMEFFKAWMTRSNPAEPLEQAVWKWKALLKAFWCARLQHLLLKPLQSQALMYILLNLQIIDLRAHWELHGRTTDRPTVQARGWGPSPRHNSQHCCRLMGKIHSPKYRRQRSEWTLPAFLTSPAGSSVPRPSIVGEVWGSWHQALEGSTVYSGIWAGCSESLPLLPSKELQEQLPGIQDHAGPPSSPPSPNSIWKPTVGATAPLHPSGAPAGPVGTSAPRGSVLQFQLCVVGTGLLGA